MANKKISELPAATTPILAGVKFEAVQGGINVQVDAVDLLGSSITREFDRAFTSELIFDKNEIDYLSEIQDDDIDFSVAPIGHLTNQFSVAVMTIKTDGVHAINFVGFTPENDFIYGITNGDIPEAGTYQLFWMYRNGKTTANWLSTSAEVSNLTPLTAPAAFTATADGENEIDLAWTDNADASSYEIYYSANGVDGWVLLNSPAAGATSYSHTGLSAGQQVFYRIRAIGDLVVFANSQYSTANAVTEDSGSVDGPVPSYSIADTTTDVPINEVLVITFDQPARKADGTEITNANAGDVVKVRQTNTSGSIIPCTFSVNVGKTEITVTPDVIYGVNQVVSVQVLATEDFDDNLGTNDDITFTTGEYTRNLNNYLDFGDVLDSIFSANDADFSFEFTCKDLLLSGGTSILFRKYASLAEASFLLSKVNDDVVFRFYAPTGGIREITWNNALISGEHTYRLHYTGAVDTNNGLDRAALYRDAGLLGSKFLTSATTSWPFNIDASAAPLLAGPIQCLVKDIKVLSANNTVTELDVPVVRTGEDVSGNNLDGTYTSF